MKRFPAGPGGGSSGSGIGRGAPVAKAVEMHRDALVPGAGGEVRGDVLDVPGELLGGSLARPLEDRVRYQLGEAGLGDGNGVDAVEEPHLDGDEGNRVIRDDEYPGAVLQLSLDWHRRIGLRGALDRFG